MVRGTDGRADSWVLDEIQFPVVDEPREVAILVYGYRQSWLHDLQT